MTYQWFHDGKRIGGATQQRYTINNVNREDAGAYAVQVVNAAGSVMSSNAVLTVLIPPQVTAEPVDQLVAAGQSASFTVVASGSAPLSYQWLLDDAVLPDATAATLTLAAVQLTDSGRYCAVVWNPVGSATSAVATLTVLMPPMITTEPQSQTVIAGQGASFAVGADGTPPLSYQWSLGNTALVGATNATLTLINVQPANAGDYSVVVSNLVGSVPSAVATLVVTNPPCTIPPRFDSVAMTPQGFSVQLSGSAGCVYVLQASSNLVDWMVLATNATPTGTLRFTDSAAPALGIRFYRAEVQ